MSRYEKLDVSQDLSPEAIQSEVERILASEKFARSKRLRSLLRFTVAQTLQGNADTLKEYVIGTEVLKKPDSYDPRSDSLVRVLASRLRVKLKEYYSDGGSDDPLVIEFPKGKYVPKFQRREQLQTEIEKKLRARNACSLGRFRATKFTQASLAEAAQHFEEAVEADPNWPAPHECLANVYALQAFLGFRRPREIWPLVRAQADATLQLDEMSSDAHVCLGMMCAFYECRWRDAESHFQKAMERDSYSGAAHLWRAIATLIPNGKTKEAQQELTRATELAPAPFLDEARLLALYFSEQYDEVVRITGEMDAHARPAWACWIRAISLAALGQTSEAIDLMERGREQGSDQAQFLANLGYLYGTAGQIGKARELLAELHARRAAGSWVPNYDLALVESVAGDRNDALTLLHEGLREKEPSMLFLAVDPRLSSLRAMPKFASLLRRIMLTDNEEIRVQGASQGINFG